MSEDGRDTDIVGECVGGGRVGEAVDVVDVDACGDGVAVSAGVSGRRSSKIGWKGRSWVIVPCLRHRLW